MVLRIENGGAAIAWPRAGFQRECRAPVTHCVWSPPNYWSAIFVKFPFASFISR
jgi:hypothetical protein